MPDELSVKLCELVQQHPEVYDTLNDNYHNEETKNNAWEAIAQQLGVPKSKCVIKWKTLEHRFIKAKKEQNTEWDMWPWLQFCDDAAAVKGGSRKRKRESSTSTPVQMVVPADDSATEPRALSKSPQKGEAKKATIKGRRTARTKAFSSVPHSRRNLPERAPTRCVILKRTARMSTCGSGNFIFTGPTEAKPQQIYESPLIVSSYRTKASASVPQSSNKLPEPAVQPADVRCPPTFKHTARYQECLTELDYSRTSSTSPCLPTDIIKVEDARKERSKKNVTWQAMAGKTPPRGRRSTARPVVAPESAEGKQPKRASKESPKKDAAASPQPRSRRQQDTASKTPRGRRSTASKESPKKDVAASPQPRSRRLQATASKTPRGRRSTARPVIAVEVIPEDEQAGSSSAKDQQPKRASKESPKKDAAASPQPRSRRLQATASKTPRGRRSTARPVLAEVAEEEQQAGSSKDEEPRTKRARIAGNGVGADNQADALRDMAFSTVLDRKFFKLLQKFATLRPEVVSAKKADILKMLGEAAEG